MNLENTEKVKKVLDPKKVWIPIIIGLVAVTYLFFNEDNIEESLHKITDVKLLPFLVALLVLLARDTGYVLRINTITENKLKIWSCITIIILWEFSSAVTPSVVGGTMVAIFLLYKEGITFGKALAFVMVTATFDNLFFILAAPIAYLLEGQSMFSDYASSHTEQNSIRFLFFTSYGLIFLYTCFMSYGLFINPRAFKLFVLFCTRFKYLRKFKLRASNFGDEIILASKGLTNKQKRYWIKIALFTIFIWVARYAMLNSLAASFQTISIQEHSSIFAKQIILWVVMLISPTPGSAGTAEIFFQRILGSTFGEYTLIINILWRFLTYFAYLFLGAFVLPRWISKVFYIVKE